MHINEINIKKTYLARYHFNNKHISWQPCKILSTKPIKNQNGFDVLPIIFFDDKKSEIFINDNQTIDGFNNPTLKTATEKWLTQELNKHNNIINEHQTHINNLLKFFYHD